jgi:predicted ferric reductase
VPTGSTHRRTPRPGVQPSAAPVNATSAPTGNGNAGGAKSIAPVGLTPRLPDHRTLLLAAVITAGALPVLALWWSDSPPFTLHAPGGYITAAGRLTGLLAAYLLLVLTALMARIPWIENRIGADTSVRMHRALGEYTVSLAACHALLIILGYAQAQHTNPVSETVTLELDYPDVLMSTAALGLLIWVGIVSARAVRRRMAYESWYFIHLYVYLAMALAFSHEFAVGTDFSASLRNRILWSGIHIAVAIALVAYRIVLPLTRSLTHRVRVEAVTVEGPGVISIHLSGRALDRLRAQPGQYLRWRFLTRRHWWQSHPYSLSAPPTTHRMRITVKDLGDHSSDLRDLRPGTRVWFEGPYGAFTAARRDARQRRRTLLIAAGAGITPIRALYETLPGRGSDVILLYRASAPEDLVLYDELTRIARRRGFGLYPLIGPRIGPDPLRHDALRHLVPDIAHRDIYLCGPPGLTALTTGHLRQAGVPSRRIHTETFDL